MAELYHFAIVPLAFITALLVFLTRPSTSESLPTDFIDFRRNLIVGYALSIAVEALTAPYGMILFQEYEYTQEQIGLLYFLASFAVMATIWRIGPCADKYGRRNLCVVFCGMFGIVNILGHCKYYPVMCLGIAVCQVAQAILTSVYESWLVAESVSRNFSGSMLSYLLSIWITVHHATRMVAGGVTYVTTHGSTVKSIYTGSHMHYGGILNSFDLSLVCCAAAGAFIYKNWHNNFGDGNRAGLKEGWRLIREDRRAAMLGTLISLFEGSVAAFMLHFAKALNLRVENGDAGMLLVAFAMANQCGASSYILLIRKVGGSFKHAVYILGACLVGGLACFVVAAGVVGVESLYCVEGLALLSFMFFVGLYRPVIAMLKGALVKDGLRSTVYTMFEFSSRFAGLVLTIHSEAAAFLWCAGAMCIGITLIAPFSTMQAPEEGGEDADSFFGRTAKAV